MLNYSYDDVAGHSEGDIVKIDGRNYFLEKKRSQAIKVRRWYWFDTVAAKVMKALGGA